MMYIQTNGIWTKFYPITSRDFVDDNDKIDTRPFSSLRDLCGDSIYGKYVGASPSHVATIFCNHLAKLLQKIVASQKNQHITFCYYLL